MRPAFGLIALLFVGCHQPRNAVRVMLRPGYDEAWGDLADARFAAGRTDSALEAYLRALRLDPRDGEWQRRVAALGGEELLLREIDLVLPDSTVDDEAIGDRADVYLGLGRTADACEMYRRAHAIDDDDGEWLGKLGECDPTFVPPGAPPPPTQAATQFVRPPAAASMTPVLEFARAGQTVAARNALWTVLLVDPHHTDARELWLVSTGESMATLLGNLSAVHPADAQLWGDLGDARLAAGDRDGAIAAWQQAAALDPASSAWPMRLEMARLGAGTPK